MHLPDTGWNHGSWIKHRDHFRLLGRMIGLSDRPSSDDLQGVLKRVASAKVFAESVGDFLAEAGNNPDYAANELEHINKKLGTMEPVPFRSMLRGEVNPTTFRGVAIWPAGTVGWTELRWQQIKLAEQAGARFDHIIVLGSSRVCNAAADRRHPYIREIPEGQEPTERELMRQWVRASGHLDAKYVFPDLPQENDQGKPLTLEQQLRELRKVNGPISGYMYPEIIPGSKPIYVPANPNALYVPLHVRRVLGKSDIWFSQGGARIQRDVPNWWWPQVQDLMTTPSGIIRLWIELVEAGCIQYN